MSITGRCHCGAISYAAEGAPEHHALCHCGDCRIWSGAPMAGWKRIVVTVGEKIGKQHMTYGMGASAELVAAGTILAADRFGLPVSTTHILSSGIAGASVASGQGLQRRTLLQLAAAWVMTLPVAMLLSGLLYWALLAVVRGAGF